MWIMDITLENVESGYKATVIMNGGGRKHSGFREKTMVSGEGTDSCKLNARFRTKRSKSEV